MNDVDIKTSDCNFKFRVCGIIIVNNKVLAVEIKRNGFYCLPGGHVHLNESTKEAIIREIKEEVLCDSKINKLIAINENFFKAHNKNYHELGFYYILDPNMDELNKEDYVFMENDEGEIKELSFKWLDLDKIQNEDFRPKFLKDKLSNRDFDFVHYINKEKN